MKNDPTEECSTGSLDYVSKKADRLQIGCSQQKKSDIAFLGRGLGKPLFSNTAFDVLRDSIQVS